MATNKHRVTITLDDLEYEHLSRIAKKFGKTLSWTAAFAVRGLTKEVGTGGFKVFRQWTLEQPSMPEASPKPSGVDSDG